MFWQADEEYALHLCLSKLIDNLRFTGSDTALAHPDERYQAEAAQDEVDSGQEVFNLLKGRVVLWVIQAVPFSPTPPTMNAT